MTLLSLSAYNTKFDEAFQTLQLKTHSYLCSPIQNLHSASSSSMSPQVLFPQCPLQKQLSPSLYPIGRPREDESNPAYCQPSQSNLLGLLGGEIHESFQVDQSSSAYKHVAEPNQRGRANGRCNKQNRGCSSHNSQKNVIKINLIFTQQKGESRTSRAPRRTPLNQFQQKLQDLRDNVGRLKTVVDRFLNPQKRPKSLDPSKAIHLQSQSAAAHRLTLQIKKNSESTESGNRCSNFQAKSARGEQAASSTPLKCSPKLSEFHAKSITKSDIDQMSPIVCLGEFSECGERKLNTSEMSSRMVMKKKFNWKSAANTV